MFCSARPYIHTILRDLFFGHMPCAICQDRLTKSASFACLISLFTFTFLFARYHRRICGSTPTTYRHDSLGLWLRLIHIDLESYSLTRGHMTSAFGRFKEIMRTSQLRVCWNWNVVPTLSMPLASDWRGGCNEIHNGVRSLQSLESLESLESRV